MEIQITLEDFKLIKSFYPELTRKPGIQTNEFVIGWSELMPVIEKIDGIYDYDRSMHDRVVELPVSTHINEVYVAVVEFIKWYNSNVPIKENSPEDGVRKHE